MTKKLPLAATILLRKGDLFLAVSRKDNPEAFGLPGGKVDPGETPMQAAIRELKEETGMDCHNVQFLYEGACPGGTQDYWVTCFTADSSSQICTQEAGVVKWVTKATLLSGPFGAFNQQALLLLDR